MTLVARQGFIYIRHTILHNIEIEANRVGALDLLFGIKGTFINNIRLAFDTVFEVNNSEFGPLDCRITENATNEQDNKNAT